MLKKLLIVSSASLLMACGGGSSGGSNEGSGGGAGGDLKTGTITGLGGLTYITDSQSGFLSSNGEYQYKEGEQVSILLGDMPLGDTFDAGAEMSIEKLLHLDKLPENPAQIRGLLRLPEFTRERIRTVNELTYTKGTYNKLHSVSNIMRLLIALDNDQDKNNGYDVSNHKESIAGINFDLNTSLYEFASSTQAVTFQHEKGISLAMEDARPLREAYEWAGLSVDVPVRQSVYNGATLSYNSINQVSSTSEEQTTDSVTEYFYEYDATGGISKKTQLTGPNSEASSASEHKIVTTNSYNDFGLVQTSREDRYETDNTTVIEEYTIETSTYLNDRVYPTNVRTLSYASADDLVYSSSVRTEYNGDLKKTKNGTYSGNDTASEVFEYGSDNYTYDDQGRITGYDYENLNSNSESSYSFSYATVDGNTVSTRLVDRVSSKEKIEETINSDGQMVKRVTTDLNSIDQVLQVETITYSYNDLGLISQCLYEEDNDLDGDIDRRYQSNLTYSDEGLTAIKTTTQTDLGSSETNFNIIYGDDGETKSSIYDAFTYGNLAENGISYLINEYSNPVSEFKADGNMVFNSSSTKCESIYRLGYDM